MAQKLFYKKGERRMRSTRIWLIIAASLVLIGSIILGGVMTMIKWDISKLSTAKYETNNYEISEKYTDILIVTNTADVVLVPSESEKTTVLCHEQNNIKHSVSVKDDALTIEVEDTRKWYEYIGINIGTPKITVTVPAKEYGTLSVRSDTGKVEVAKEFTFENVDISGNTGNVTNYACASGNVKIKTTTGSITVENISASNLELSVSTGNITVSDVICENDVKVNVSTGKTNLGDIKCKNLTTVGSTGNVSLKNVITSEKLSVKRTTGKINFDRCDAAELAVSASTGNVYGTLLSEKVFLCESSTGKVSVPKTTSGGRCEITTSTGDIIIEITP